MQYFLARLKRLVPSTVKVTGDELIRWAIRNRI